MYLGSFVAFFFIFFSLRGFRFLFLFGWGAGVFSFCGDRKVFRRLLVGKVSLFLVLVFGFDKNRGVLRVFLTFF